MNNGRRIVTNVIDSDRYLWGEEMPAIKKISKEAIIDAAVDMLRDKIEHGTQGYVHQILLPTLIRRGTCKEPFSR